MINFELNKKINKIERKNEKDFDSCKKSNLLKGVGSNGTIQENSSFNLDEIPIPINLNFTQSIDNSLSAEVKNTPVVTKTTSSLEL